MFVAGYIIVMAVAVCATVLGGMAYGLSGWQVVAAAVAVVVGVQLAVVAFVALSIIRRRPADRTDTRQGDPDRHRQPHGRHP